MADILDDYVKGEKTGLWGTIKNWRRLAAVLIVWSGAVFVIWSMFREGGDFHGGKFLDRPVWAEMDQGRQNAHTAPGKALAEENVITLSLDWVKKEKLVFLRYGKREKQVALMAFITPAGRITTAVSFCEPCLSTKFHIEGHDLVCDLCRTKWHLEDLQAVSGCCRHYSPAVVNHRIEGQKIVVKETDLLRWARV